MNRVLICLLVLSGLALCPQPNQTHAQQTKADQPQLATEFAAPDATINLRRHKEGAAAEIRDGALQLLSGKGGEANSAAWPLCAPGSWRQIEAQWRLRLTPGVKGASFALLNTAHFANEGPAFQLLRARGISPDPREPEWDEPNLWGSFALAFDASNPPTEDPFNAFGNVHDRPQREVSLHFDGREIFNAACPVDFATGEWLAVKLELAFVTGGAEVTLNVAGKDVYSRAFVPHLLPYESRAALAAVGDAPGQCAIDDLQVRWKTPAAQTPAPVTVQTFHSEWLTGGRSEPEREFDLLPPEFAERVILTYRFKPMVDRDEWDRQAAVYAWDGDSRIEIARILTPFQLWGATYEFVVDVSDYRQLLVGRRKLCVFAGANVNKGFVVDLDLTYYRKPADVPALPKVLALKNVWSGHAHFNNPDSVKKTFGERTVDVPAGTRGAKLRITVTGHGSLEFKPMDRTVLAGGKEFKNTLWTSDCYLNPYRPQFGTWKYDRAGWGPGSVARTWEIDLKDCFEPGKPLKLTYTSQELDTKDWAEHWIEGQVIFYG